MSARWNGQELLQPIAPDAPCGESLEDSPVLASVDAARLFGQARPYDAPEDKNVPYQWKPPDWGAFRGLVSDGLRRSHDLRLLVNLSVALLRTDGIPAFLQTLPVASHWLEAHWAETFPRLDEGDALLRRNALNCFADPMAVIDGLRRLPLVSSRQHGTFSLRDIEVATGQQPPRPGEAAPDQVQIDAAFAAMPIEELTELDQSVSAALTAARQIDVAMGTNAGPDAVPTLDGLTAPLGRLDRVVKAQLAARVGADSAAPVVAGDGAAAGVPQGAVGPIRSRQDVIRALDAVSEYFRHNEPSSPVPLFVDRAKRLVSKNFLEVLEDVVPDALPQVRSVSGVREGT
jgi:type VI secretion system protein ImpA